MPLKKTIRDIFEKMKTRKKPKEGTTQTSKAVDIEKEKNKGTSLSMMQTVSTSTPLAKENNKERPATQTVSTSPPLVKENNKERPTAEQQWVEMILEFGVDRLINEYRGLSKWCPSGVTMEAFHTNRTKNRYLGVPCQDKNRVLLQRSLFSSPNDKSDYIHANYVGTPIKDKRFICTQGPLESTVADFWRMVIDEDCKNIIMLCNCKEGKKHKCAQYWPNEVKQLKMVEVDGFFIEIYCKKIEPMSPDHPNVVVSIFETSFSKPGKTEGVEMQQVRHYHWRDFPARGVPACNVTMMEILSRVRASRGPITVHCSNGIGRSSIPIAIEYILDTIENKLIIPGLDLIMTLRDQRLYMFNTALQYLYIHRVLLHYLLEKKDPNGRILSIGDNAAKYKKFIKDYDAYLNTTMIPPDEDDSGDVEE